MAPQWPGNFAEALVSLDQSFSDARWVFMANRDVWEAIAERDRLLSHADDEEFEADRYGELEDFMPICGSVRNLSLQSRATRVPWSHSSCSSPRGRLNPEGTHSSPGR